MRPFPLLLALAVPAAAAPLALAPTFVPTPIDAHWGSIDLTIPAGDLPPGPAEAFLDAPSGFSHRVRFLVPSGGPALVRLWRPVGSKGMFSPVRARVRARDVERYYSGRPDRELPFGEHALLFVGSAEQHAAAPATDMSLLVAPGEALRRGCRPLAYPTVAAVIVADEESIEPMRACVALGAREVLIDNEGEEVGPLKAWPADVALLWGLGQVRWTRSPGAAGAALDLAWSAYAPPLERLLDFPISVPAPGAQRRDPLGTLVWFGLFAASAVLAWTARRSRRIVKFPLWLSVVVTFAWAVATTRSPTMPSAVRVAKMAVLDPLGHGLERTTVSIAGGRARVTLPARDPDLVEIANPSKIALDEDTLRGTLAIDSLDDGGRIAIDAPAGASVPRLLRDGDGFAIENPQASPIARATLLVRGRSGSIASLGPHVRRVVALADAEPTNGCTLLPDLRHELPDDAFVLATCEQVHGAPGITTTPTVDATTSTERIVVGPLPR